MSGTRERTLDQRRARHAWEAVSAAEEKHQGSYAREAKRFPVRIRTAGLGHALAFLEAKQHPQVVRDLDDWVLEQRKLPGAPPGAANLTEAIVKGDASFLQLATEEALAYLQWLTRFAEARFGDSADWP